MHPTDLWPNFWINKKTRPGKHEIYSTVKLVTRFFSENLKPGNSKVTGLGGTWKNPNDEFRRINASD
jgi:hypothetical protein